MSRFIYKGSRTSQISFPLGGIGTGCIGISGSGRLVDWEIKNKPSKGSINGFSHFAVKAEADGKVVDARVLNGDLPPPYTGVPTRGLFGGFGFGPERGTMASVPHFKDVEFRGEFPIAQLKFLDPHFPGQVIMTAFNPFIPLDDKDSSIPGAFFAVEIENTHKLPLDYTVCLSVNNPVPKGRVNTFIEKEGLSLIKLAAEGMDPESPDFGDVTVATDASDVSLQQYWYRGSWFDNLATFWSDFNTPGKLKNRVYSDAGGRGSDTCSLAGHIRLNPGEKRALRFIITWNFPNRYNYWNPEKCDCGGDESGSCKPRTWLNYYATIFKDSTESAVYSLKNWDRLYDKTLLFKESLFSSSLPEEIIDAVSANISILKSPTCLRLTDGSFYGFEGCHTEAGCCDGSCTHVWNYAYALPFLFPKLERSMRSLDYKYNQREDGSMAFRLQLPLGRGRSSFRACADGQFGGVVKAYRDWKISGDTQWLKSIWEELKKSVEFAWSPTNEDRWDRDKDGVLEGRQHHTLDMELFGPNSWLTGFYLAALKAASEIAGCFGETDKAAEYMELFEKGKKWCDTHLFNGEYYHQLIDLKDKSILDLYSEGDAIIGGSAAKVYWNEEKQEIKYQLGEGCAIDQVIAQWHANICGLGEIFDNAQVKKALESIFKYNFKRSFREFFNPCRIYALNDEAGVVIFDWPEGKYKPAIPAPYAEEPWSGCEYQFAAHLIQEGLVDQGLQVVRAVRDRFDGEKRNPWNEFECGSNYARAMSSYSLLLAYSGFKFDMVKGMVGFNPVHMPGGNFRCFWSLDSGWGIFKATAEKITLSVLYGKLSIGTLSLPFIKGRKAASLSLAGAPAAFRQDGTDITFDTPVAIEAGSSLVIELA